MRTPLLFLVATLGSAAASAQVDVPWRAQTPPIPSTQGADLALVVQPGSPALARVVSADPLNVGLYAYGPDAGLVQVLTVGPANSVAAVAGFGLDGGPVPLVAAGSSVLGRVLLYASYNGTLVEVSAAPLFSPTPTTIALRRLPDAGAELFAGNGALIVGRYLLLGDGAGRVAKQDAGALTLPGTPSGLVVDEAAGMLYAAIPQLGIVRIDLSNTLPSAVVERTDGGSLLAPVGGLAYFPLRDGGLVLATVPTRNEVVAYRAGDPLVFLARFGVALGTARVRSPEFIDVTASAVAGYPQGLLVVHDGLNVTGDNYKLVGWDDVVSATGLPIDGPIDGGVDAGAPDAGTLDAGVDGGAADAGADAGVDGGAGGGAGGGSGGGGGGTGGGSAGGAGGGRGGGSGGGGGVEEPPAGCGCGQVPAALLPVTGVLIFAVSIRTRRRRT